MAHLFASQPPLCGQLGPGKFRMVERIRSEAVKSVGFSDRIEPLLHPVSVAMAPYFKTIYAQQVVQYEADQQYSRKNIQAQIQRTHARNQPFNFVARLLAFRVHLSGEG